MQRAKGLPKSRIFTLLSLHLFPAASVSTTHREAGANLISQGNYSGLFHICSWLASFSSDSVEILFCKPDFSCMCAQSPQEVQNKSWIASTGIQRLVVRRQEGNTEGPCPESQGGDWCSGKLCSHFSVLDWLPP